MTIKLVPFQLHPDALENADRERHERYERFELFGIDPKCTFGGYRRPYRASYGEKAEINDAIIEGLK